jgi:hypothetical protein
MTELEILRQEIAAFKAKLTETTTKDLSLVTLVQNWTGMSASCGLQKFFNSVDTTVDLGNLDEKARLEDAIKIAVTVQQAGARDHKGDAFIVNGRPGNICRSRIRERKKIPHRRKYSTGSAQTDISSPT